MVHSCRSAGYTPVAGSSDQLVGLPVGGTRGICTRACDAALGASVHMLRRLVCFAGSTLDFQCVGAHKGMCINAQGVLCGPEALATCSFKGVIGTSPKVITHVLCNNFVAYLSFYRVID